MAPSAMLMVLAWTWGVVGERPGQRLFSLNYKAIIIIMPAAHLSIQYWPLAWPATKPAGHLAWLGSVHVSVRPLSSLSEMAV